ncbi:MAG: LD-carboxypeptidase [Bdellovibrionota bacterium]
MAKQINKWLPLERGDVVDIVAPGSSCKMDSLQKGLDVLESWGLEPRMPKDIFGADVICSNSDEERFKQLKTALTSEDSVAVWCVRGGYGANRLIPRLMKLKRPAGPPKLFMGFSDITTLHVFLNEQWGWPTIHGPMIDRIGRGLILEPQLAEVRSMVFGDLRQIEFKNLKPMNDLAHRAKTIKAPVTGGNAMTLQSSIGTKAPWKSAGSIVFLEEIDERGYRVDRILEHLEQTGHFAKAKAIVLGDFLGGDEPDGTNRVWSVVERWAQNQKVPVLRGLGAGHGDLQRPVPFQTMATLTTGAKSQLVIDTGVFDVRKKR